MVREGTGGRPSPAGEREGEGGREGRISSHTH